MIDALINEFDKGLRTLFAVARTTRKYPGQEECEEPDLLRRDKAHSAALMRINHVGEVCAQALYQGQALMCRDSEIRNALARSANEETDHLAWTEERIGELMSRKSFLNPLWYLGSLSLGVFVGKVGDAWSLGFLAETEKQVEAHLDRHLSELPASDLKSRAIIRQMKIDESGHADRAIRLGSLELPTPAKTAMRLMAGVMTRVAYFF